MRSASISAFHILQNVPMRSSRGRWISLELYQTFSGLTPAQFGVRYYTLVEIQNVVQLHGAFPNLLQERQTARLLVFQCGLYFPLSDYRTTPSVACLHTAH